MPEIKVPAWSVLVRALCPASQTAVLVCSHSLTGCAHKEKESALSSFYKATNPIKIGP